MSKKPHAHGGFPSDFKRQPGVIDKLIAYKATQPPTNWLGALEAEIGTTLLSIQGKGVNAMNFDKLKDSNHKLSMNETEACDKDAEPLVQHMEGGLQVIKKIHEPDYSLVRLFGANCSVTGLITIPSDRIEQMAMFKLYSDKYATYAPSPTPIDFYNTKHNIIMANDVLKMATVISHHNNSVSFKDISENNTELRNTEWEPGVEFLVRIYNVAKATFKDYFRELGLMGFDISENSPGHVDQTSTALQSSQILVHGAIIGSVIENLNPFDVILHPGIVMGHPSVIVPANSLTAVKKFMSSFIFENPDPLHKAQIRVTVRHH